MARLTQRERDRFDGIVEEVIDSLPPHWRARIDETPVLVEDRPSPSVLREFGLDESQADEICGLHSGTPLTERSVSDTVEEPETIHLYRIGILALAGGWEEGVDEDGEPMGGEAIIREEIRVTLLHELGHHFGLDEDDLEGLGYD